MKNIEFRGVNITVEEARKMVTELETALTIADPVLVDYPVGQKIPVLVDPSWFTEPAPLFAGTILSFRSPSMGWHGFVIPWQSVAKLIGLFSQQMAIEVDSGPVAPPAKMH